MVGLTGCERDRRETAVEGEAFAYQAIGDGHPGMEFHDADAPQGLAHAMCAADFSNIRATIGELLVEPGPEHMVAMP